MPKFHVTKVYEFEVPNEPTDTEEYMRQQNWTPKEIEFYSVSTDAAISRLASEENCIKVVIGTENEPRPFGVLTDRQLEIIDGAMDDRPALFEEMRSDPHYDGDLGELDSYIQNVKQLREHITMEMTLRKKGL